MSTVKTAKKVLYELKKNGYEAYIVGGAVRDYLLRMPTTDVDITTNAKPFQVGKVFKSIPTGLKFGTVTVVYGEEQFEVTTYRLDGDYLNHRHPEEVVYAEKVEDDVMRRDFTINGLLMNEKNEIFDYVEGKLDIERKLIRAIGDPMKRFEEDALRIMRAFYFQSKLGFQIDRDTRDAIEKSRHLLKEIAMERILQEIIKMFKGPYLKRALHSMITTKVHEVLPGLKEGILKAVELDQMPYMDVFFTMSFYLNGSIPKEWPLSNKHKHRYEQSILLMHKKQPFDALTLYTYGMELCMLANRASFALGKAKLYTNQIEKDFKELPIQSDMDLKIRPNDMMSITSKKAGAWIKQLQTEMVEKVLLKQLINDKDALTDYVKAHVK
ncbi:MAG: CCA tRNA nucleotidyltransferase [Tenericutes bacterium HGW-Tenericutes-6]|jgi:tRNA nucleotidyltransferase (CCA-adding enzyme)|nr:MAG: CCA tRNA nucleotidyltransferase [Tenericutes bacterium HGW-Tenericutes-6]